MSGGWSPIPGMAGLPLRKHQPYQLFRYGEQVISGKTIFGPGMGLGEGMPGAWEWRICQSCAYDVMAVMWEVFAEPEDLQELLWGARLDWDFVNTTVPISHLNFATGSIGDFFFPQEDDRTDMEKLAATIKEGHLPPEEVWRALAQATALGRTICFRGRKVYRKMPVSLPKDSACSIRMVLDEPFTPKAEVRFRVALDGVFKNTIEVG
jgi:hypothetical protein